MAHLSDGTLRRRFDDQDSLTASDARHYAACADCQARYAALADDARAIASLLAVPALKVDVESAFSRVMSAPKAQPRFGFRLPVMRPNSRPMLMGLGAAAVLVALIGTVIAKDLITAFAPTTVTAVPVTTADMQSLSNLSAYGTIVWTNQPQPQLVNTAAEAQSISGLKLPVVGTLPPGVSTTLTYAAMTQAVGVFTFNAATAAASAARSGKTLPPMPSGMDGSTLTVTVGPALVEIYGNLNSGSTQINLPQLVIAESTAPVVTSSHSTATEIENYLLAQPGISPGLAAAIRAIKDPSTTLLIPVPMEYASSTPVQVQGVQGVALGDNTGLGAAVIWIKNGVVYGVGGTLKQSAILDVANHLS